MNSNQEQIEMFGYTANKGIIPAEHRDEMLDHIVSFFSLESKHNEFQRSFVHKVRVFFNSEQRKTFAFAGNGQTRRQTELSNNAKIRNKNNTAYESAFENGLTHQDLDSFIPSLYTYFTSEGNAIFYKEFYKKNKNSQLRLKLLTKEIITLLAFDEFFLYLISLDMDVEGEDWYLDCLDELFEMPEIMNRLQEFIISAINDSQRKHYVCVKKRTPNPLDLTKNHIELTWYIDQEFIFSNEIYEREEGLSALFDCGLIMHILGFFDRESSPTIIKNFLDELKLPSVSLWNFLDYESNLPISQISNAWRKGDLGKVKITRGKNKITMEWYFPDYFEPFDIKDIEEQSEDLFYKLNEYQYFETLQGSFRDISDDIYNLIINSHGY